MRVIKIYTPAIPRTCCGRSAQPRSKAGVQSPARSDPCTAALPHHALVRSAKLVRTLISYPILSVYLSNGIGYAVHVQKNAAKRKKCYSAVQPVQDGSNSTPTSRSAKKSHRNARYREVTHLSILTLKNLDEIERSGQEMLRRSLKNILQACAADSLMTRHLMIGHGF